MTPLHWSEGDRCCVRGLVNGRIDRMIDESTAYVVLDEKDVWGSHIAVSVSELGLVSFDDSKKAKGVARKGRDLGEATQARHDSRSRPVRAKRTRKKPTGEAPEHGLEIQREVSAAPVASNDSVLDRAVVEDDDLAGVGVDVPPDHPPATWANASDEERRRMTDDREDRIIHAGDCIAWLETFADASVDHVIMDPPYSEHVHAKSLSGPTKAGAKGLRNQTSKRSERRSPVGRDLGFASITPALQRAAAIECARVARRWVLVFCDIENVGTWRFDLAGAGLDVVRTGVWIKPNCAPQFTGDRPASGLECVVIAHRRGAKRWNGGGTRAVWTHNIATGSYGGERIHKTEKPITLALELVELFTDPGELVIDPFAGSAVFGVAARRLGRRFLGAELDPAAAHLANERLLAEASNMTLRDRQRGQLPLLGPAA